MARFIFLEVEGVLVNEIARRTAILLNDPELKAFKPSIAALDRIVATTRAQVVVTSSWRAMGLGALQDAFRKWGAKAAVTDVTPQDATKSDAISHFLHSCREWGYGKMESFVLIDHEPVRSFEWATVLVDRERAGLTSALADDAIAILNDVKRFAHE